MELNDGQIKESIICVRIRKKNLSLRITVCHHLACLTMTNCDPERQISCLVMGALFFSGRVLDSRPRGGGFEPHWRHCVVSLSKKMNPSLVLVQPRKTHPFITERLLVGHKESNQTNKLSRDDSKSKGQIFLFYPHIHDRFFLSTMSPSSYMELSPRIRSKTMGLINLIPSTHQHFSFWIPINRYFVKQ